MSVEKLFHAIFSTVFNDYTYCHDGRGEYIAHKRIERMERRLRSQIALLESKRVPVKPVWRAEDSADCPNCGYLVSFPWICCPDCGQPLDWREM